MKPVLIQAGVLIGVLLWIYIAIAFGEDSMPSIQFLMFLTLAWWTSWLFIKRPKTAAT